jgi:hypothetical protein
LSAKEIKKIKAFCGLTDDDEILGATDDNRSKKKELIVSDKIEKDDPQEFLKVLIDEAFHALDSTIDNRVVDEKARDLASFLWKCGYRRTAI